MVDDANALVVAINDQCNIAKTGALTGPPSDANVQCIKGHFEEQRVTLILRSLGPARDEATLEPAETIAIQRALQAKSYLPASADIDGVFPSCPCTYAGSTSSAAAPGFGITVRCSR